MASLGVQSHLSIMEAFGNLIPGVILLVGIGASLSSLEDLAGATLPKLVTTGSLGVGELVMFGIVAFVVGLVLQGVGHTVEHSVDKLARGEQSPFGKQLSARLQRTSLRRKIKCLSKEPSTTFEAKFWETCKNEFPFLNSPIGDEDASQLWKAIQTSLSASPYSHAQRYRALNNLCRGLWAGFGFLLMYYLAVLYAVGLIWAPARVFMTLASGVILSASFMLAFWRFKNVFKVRWYETLMLEYYLFKSGR